MKEKIRRKIILEDGAFGSLQDRVCEIVFNTSMAGYQEILSDLSYTDQAVVMTYPLIGNYGMAAEDYESEIPSIGAMIVREYNYSRDHRRGHPRPDPFDQGLRHPESPPRGCLYVHSPGTRDTAEDCSCVRCSLPRELQTAVGIPSAVCRARPRGWDYGDWEFSSNCRFVRRCCFPVRGTLCGCHHRIAGKKSPACRCHRLRDETQYCPLSEQVGLPCDDRPLEYRP